MVFKRHITFKRCLKRMRNQQSYIFLINLPQMLKDQGAECFHKIKQFQFHKGCNLFAAICQNQCQMLHSGDVSVMSVQAVQDHFQGIRQLIFKEIKKLTDKLKDIYNQMIYQLQKQQSENIMQMEKQLLKELVKNLDLEKNFINKLENKRFQRIKCHQLRNFMEESNIQQKIKKSAHINLYNKYEGTVVDFKEKFFKYSSQLIESRSSSTGNSSQINSNASKPRAQKSVVVDQPSRPEQKNVSKGGQNQANKLPYYFDKQQLQHAQAKAKAFQEQYKNLEKLYKGLESELRKKKYELSCAITEKKNLQRLVDKGAPKKTLNLRRKTWNIFKVHTKKIKKELKIINIQQKRGQHMEEEPENRSSIQSSVEEPRQIIPESENSENSSGSRSESSPIHEPRQPQMNQRSPDEEEGQKVPAICLEATKPMFEVNNHRNEEESPNVQSNERSHEDKLMIPEEEQKSEQSRNQIQPEELSELSQKDEKDRYQKKNIKIPKPEHQFEAEENSINSSPNKQHKKQTEDHSVKSSLSNAIPTVVTEISPQKKTPSISKEEKANSLFGGLISSIFQKK